MVSKKQLKMLSATDFDAKNKANLIDIKTINIDTALTKSDRIIKYIDAVHNPYLFKVGDTAVRVRYNKENRTLQESVAGFFISR